MNKKLVALAVAGALSPALTMADDSTVTLYGKLSLGVESVKAEGCTTNAAGACTGPTNLATGSSAGQNIPSRIRVTDNASYLGFRGNEPLGGGTSAIFQIESYIKVDSQPGRSTAYNTTTFANRDSGVGLRGPFGEIQVGNFRTYFANHIPSGDTLFLKSSLAASVSALFGASSTMGGQATALVGLTPAGGFAPANAEGRGAVDAGGFRNNVLRYTSPNWGGFTAGFNYVAPEGTVTIPTNTAASNAGKASDKGVEVRLTYLNPNLGFANYSYYKRNDYLVGTALGSVGGSIGNDSKNQKIAVGTKLVGITVGIVAEKIQHTNPDLIATPQNDSVDREVKKYALFLAYETGPWAFGTSYAKAKAVDDNTGRNCTDPSPFPSQALTSCSGTGARFYQATVLYNLSKRSNLYATFARIKNDSTAAYDFYTQGAVGDSGPSFIARGSSPQVLAVGLTHYF